MNMELRPMTPLNALRADTYRQFGRYGWWLTLACFAKSRTFRVVVTMRLCQALAQAGIRPIRILLPLLKLFHRLTCQLAAMDFSWQTKVGAGIAITHGWGLVVNQGIIIGNNVTLFHGATLGRRDRLSPDGTRSTGFPVVEDDVWIGPHAIIVGGITIGRGSRIAGGAFVTESVPPYSVVSGNPACIVKSDCTPDVMNPVEVAERHLKN
jgi:serine O-acetyltransferase